jgi:predicted nucleotidyltransferase
MSETSQGHRQQLLEALRRFVAAAGQIAGVRRIAVLGSIVTTKPNPKDIDVLVVVADDADLAPLAACARRLQGQHRVSIAALTCFSPMSGVRTSAGRATGGIVGLECGSRVMPFIAVGGHFSTTISMPLR